MSSSKNSRKFQVHELLLKGYTQEMIAQELNVSPRTIRRDVRKLKAGSETWLDNLAYHEFAFEYRHTLEALKRDMVRLNEMLEKEDIQKDYSLQLKIIKQLADTRRTYLLTLNKGPMVKSVEKAIKSNPHLVN